MLAFLTDAHISLNVAAQIKSKQPEIVIHSLRQWRDGALLDAGDAEILAAAWEDRLTLVTFDLRTIVPLVTQWAMEERDHAGVVLIDNRSIAQADVGGQVRALLHLWKTTGAQDWINSISYLQPDSV